MARLSQVRPTARTTTRPFRARLSFDLDVDICVVGAGLAGLTVALEAARLGASVAVLEGRHVGWNASGHQLGTVMPGLRPSDRRTDRARRPRGCARTLGAVEGGRRLCSRHRHRGSDAGHCAQRRRAGSFQRRCRRNADQPAADAERGFRDRSRGLAGRSRARASSRPGVISTASIIRRAFQIDGRKYVHGLAALARRAGARIFEDTPVVSIDSSGIRKRIVTPSARLRASHIVLAGNIHLGAPLRRLSETLLPVWRYAAVTEPLGERLARGHHLPGIGDRQRRHRPFPDRRRRPADVGEPGDHLGRAAAPLRRRHRSAASRRSSRSSARSRSRRCSAARSG